MSEIKTFEDLECWQYGRELVKLVYRTTEAALAVIHHLLVGANLPMAAICDLFAALTQKYVILEFVPTDDVMFRKLIEFRVNLFEHITLDQCLATFSEQFILVCQEPIQHSPRTLLLFEKRGG